MCKGRVDMRLRTQTDSQTNMLRRMKAAVSYKEEVWRSEWKSRGPYMYIAPERRWLMEMAVSDESIKEWPLLLACSISSISSSISCCSSLPLMKQSVSSSSLSVDLRVYVCDYNYYSLNHEPLFGNVNERIRRPIHWIVEYARYESGALFAVYGLGNPLAILLYALLSRMSLKLSQTIDTHGAR